jgi:pyruvate,water dikinase
MSAVETSAIREYVVPLSRLTIEDVGSVGGKNASLGEMIGALTEVGVRVPGGFATTADAYREFLRQDRLDARIAKALAALDIEDIAALASTGKQIRDWILSTRFPRALETAVLAALERMDRERADRRTPLAVAVRSSATAEDLPDASFAGQQETFLNVRGGVDMLRAMHEVFASLFNDRAIAYRVHHGFAHDAVALSVGVQRMVRSDVGTSGVMFTLDTDSGFRDAVLITASYGLGETVVQGAVNPDEFCVYKPALLSGHKSILRRALGAKALKMIYAEPGGASRVATVAVSEAERARFSLTDDEIVTLARQAVTIEKHYGRPMDIEWGKDGETGEIFILQARPETVQSRAGRTIRRYTLRERSRALISGRSIGQRIGAGPARVVRDPAEMLRVQAGDVLVTDMTDPDWEPVMKRAAAIVTNRGGRTCHAAIIARELGIPAIVGCGEATERIADGRPVTVSCAEGETGHVYDGALPFDCTDVELDALPEIPVKIMMNVANPERAFDFACIPNRGVGLARIEFIINRTIGVHPRALLELDGLDAETRSRIRLQMAGYSDPKEFFIDRLAEGVAQIAAAFARNGRPKDHHDVRDPDQRTFGRPLSRALRRHVDRFERHDSAHARRRPRFRRRREGVRRTRRRRQSAAIDGDPSLPQTRQIRRHLRSRPLGSSGLRALVARARHRQHLAEPRYRARDVVVSRATTRKTQTPATLTGGSVVARTDSLPPTCCA